jgi:hypothetical protein
MNIKNTNMKEYSEYLGGGKANSYLVTADGLFIPLGQSQRFSPHTEAVEGRPIPSTPQRRPKK